MHHCGERSKKWLWIYHEQELQSLNHDSEAQAFKHCPNQDAFTFSQISGMSLGAGTHSMSTNSAHLLVREAASSFRFLSEIWVYRGFPGGSDGKQSARNIGDPGSIPGLERYSVEGNGNPLQYSCLEKSHGQRNLAGNSPWSRKESDRTERLTLSLSGFRDWCSQLQAVIKGN